LQLACLSADRYPVSVVQGENIIFNFHADKKSIKPAK